MKLLPVWRTPIVFVADDFDLRITWGLVTFELWAPPDTSRSEFGRLADLHGELEKASVALARSDQPEGLTDATLLAAAHAEGITLDPLRHFREHELNPLMDGRFHVGPAEVEISGDPADARKLIRDFGPGAFGQLPSGVYLEPLIRSDETTVGWALRCENLVERAAVEVFDLFQLRPTLRQCSICGRVFVPSGIETNCRWHLWRLPAKGGDPPIEYCDNAQAAAFEQAEAAEHRREWSRINMRVRRARESFERAVARDGPRSKKAAAARSKLKEEEAVFAAFERRPRGRRIALRADDLKGVKQDG
jgi:hypothetical protein